MLGGALAAWLTASVAGIMMPIQKVGDMNYDKEFNLDDMTIIADLIIYEENFISSTSDNSGEIDYSEYKIADWEIRYADTNEDQIVDYKDFKIYYNNSDNFEKAVAECGYTCRFRKEQLRPTDSELKEEKKRLIEAAKTEKEIMDAEETIEIKKKNRKWELGDDYILETAINMAIQVQKIDRGDVVPNQKD